MFKKIIIGCLVLFSALVVTLAVHIYLVTQPKGNEGPNLAMSRIDFDLFIGTVVEGAVEYNVHESVIGEFGALLTSPSLKDAIVQR